MNSILGMAMTFADFPLEEIRLPPCDLWSDEPPLESDLHRDQIDLLLACLRTWWRDRNDFYATGNLTIYYSEDNITTRDFRGPDFFVVLGTENRPRRSWMVWAEGGNYPNVIVELLSNSTARVDRNEKKQLYQNTFRTPEYFWFHPETLEFEGFRLMAGQYRPIKPNAIGHRWSQQLELFLGIHDRQLRFFDASGNLLPSPEERAEQEHQRAEQERQRAEQEHQRAEQERQRVEELQRELEALRSRLQEGNG
ncbi:hypothetical protein C7B76_06845 [filamentous cyanobacterium CCP2]|nr:hypothetical protein C7B76_06845 [filamentous cyanobacterium CCP2]